jgi:Peptidase family M41
VAGTRCPGGRGRDPGHRLTIRRVLPPRDESPLFVRIIQSFYQNGGGAPPRGPARARYRWRAVRAAGRPLGNVPGHRPHHGAPPTRPGNPYGLDGAAPATRELVDTEARKIIEECYAQALDTLRGNRDRLDRLAHALLQKETLGEDEAYAAAYVSHDTVPTTPATAPPATATGATATGATAAAANRKAG